MLALIEKVYGFNHYNIAESTDITYPYGAYYKFNADFPEPGETPDDIYADSCLDCILDDLVIKGILEPGIYYIWIEY